MNINRGTTNYIFVRYGSLVLGTHGLSWVAVAKAVGGGCNGNPIFYGIRSKFTLTPDNTLQVTEITHNTTKC